MDESARLTKKQLQEQRRTLEKERVQKAERMRSIRKWGIIAGIVVLALGGVWWLMKESTKPLPGQVVAELGRDHITQDKWEKFKYNTNPPTSGPHDPEWTKAGIYDKPQGDGHLVHSLEHGYIIISYNCTKLSSKFLPRARLDSARLGEAGNVQSSKLGTESPEMSDEVWNSSECKDLKKQLADIANENRVWKLIVVPRPNLDTTIALTAWGWIDKFSTIDKKRIVSFIDAFRDHGPEQTME